MTERREGSVSGEAAGPDGLEESPSRRRLASFRLFPHEVAGLAFVVAGVALLESMPVTYPRGGVVLAAWFPLTWSVSIGLLAILGVRLAKRRGTDGARSVAGPAADLLLLLRAGLLLAPILSVHFLLKSFIHLLNGRTWDQALWDIDRALLFGLSPSLFLTGLFTSPLFLRALDFFYSSLYLIVVLVSVPLLLVLPTRPRRMAFLAAYSLIWIAGNAFYIALPSWGPVFVVPQVFEETLRHMPGTVSVQRLLFREISSLVTDPLGPRQVHLGCVAAFPSLHLAVVTVLALACRWSSRRWPFLYAAGVFVMLIGSVVTGYHYLVDGWAGILLGAGACWLGRRLFPDPPRDP